MREELPLAVLLGREEELVDRVAVAPVEVGDGACARGGRKVSIRLLADA